MHLLDLRRPWTKRHEAHKVYRLHVAPEELNIDRQKSVELTFSSVFLRETLDSWVLDGFDDT